MTCSVLQLENGARAIVCSGRRKPARCVGCGGQADLLCDWRTPDGTCDKPICANCSTSPAQDKDLCPEHAKAWSRHPKNPARA